MKGVASGAVTAAACCASETMAGEVMRVREDLRSCSAPMTPILLTSRKLPHLPQIEAGYPPHQANAASTGRKAAASGSSHLQMVAVVVVVGDVGARWSGRGVVVMRYDYFLGLHGMISL